jgi:hypothetical protein
MIAASVTAVPAGPFRLANSLSDGMVLQVSKLTPLWGGAHAVRSIACMGLHMATCSTEVNDPLPHRRHRFHTSERRCSGVILGHL